MLLANPQRNNSRLIVIIVYCFFFFANLVYLNMFSLDRTWYSLEVIENGDKYFYFPLNLDQEKAYIPAILEMEEGTFDRKAIGNATGIASVYYLLKKGLGFSEESIAIVSFIFNNIMVIICYLYFVRIISFLGLKLSYRWMFFVNPALIYFSQLINKEIISLLFVLASTYYLFTKKTFMLLFFSALFSCIRPQLLLTGVLALWLNSKVKYAKCLFLIYVVTSIAGAFLMTPDKFNEQALELMARSDGSVGLVMYTQLINQQYCIGSLLLNPIKVIQYFYDLFRSLSFMTAAGQIDLYKLRDVPFILALIYFAKPLIVVFIRIKQYVMLPCRPVITVTVVFFIVLLMNPYVHARYVFPISYNLLILGVFVSKYLRLEATKKRISTLGKFEMLPANQ